MSKSETYLDAARRFAPGDRSTLQDLAGELRAWVTEQSKAVKELRPQGGLRCLAYVTAPRRGGELVSCEFVAGRGRSHSVTIFSSGRNDLRGREPHTAGLNASIALVALLAAELGVPVTLQP